MNKDEIKAILNDPDFKFTRIDDGFKDKISEYGVISVEYLSIHQNSAKLNWPA